MKLYKDVKVELRSSLTIKFSDYFVDKVQIKKYNGQTKKVGTIESTRSYNSDYTYSNAIHRDLLDDLISLTEDTINNYKDSSFNVDIITTNDYNVDECIKETQELNRTEVIQKGKYDVSITLDIKFNV